MAANISQIKTVTAQSFRLFVLTINRMLASTVFKKTKGTGSAYNKALKTTPFGCSDAFTRGGFAIMPHATAPLSLMLATKDTMSQFFSFSFFIAYSAAILQLSFLAFSDVLDDGILTYIAVGLGISSAPAIRLFQKWKHAKSASYLIIDEPGKTPFHQRLINFPLLIVFSTFGFIGFISISNHIFASEEVHVEEFVVKAIGKRRVRYDLFEYILISNGDYATSLILGETPKTTYSVGDKLEVTLKTGLWGYYIVEDVVNGG